MLKKILLFIFLFVVSISNCKAYQMELLTKDFSFIVDTKTKTALVRKIYIGTYDEPKDIVIPEKIVFCKDTYYVDEIYDYAFEWVVKKIKSIKLPILKNSEMNGRVFRILMTYKIRIVWLFIFNEYNNNNRDQRKCGWLYWLFIFA